VDERMAVRWYPGRWEPYPAARPLASHDRRAQPVGTIAAS
jgi:hypothetical protein